MKKPTIRAVVEGYWPGDQLLRGRGFRIKSRPAPGVSVWVRDGREYQYAFALEIAKKEAKAAEEMARASDPPPVRRRQWSRDRPLP